jgi:CTP:molybdopterin cytidylyltransferase MocA
MKNKIDKKTIQIIANNAVREAQKKSLKNGVANVYSKNGVVYFQLPDGTITMQNPFEKESSSLSKAS